ncbi:response regulator [Pseudoalteromonas xiamenensis]|uniref:response regulator n=1 Tax=Pseudoalteromonas xiamenensis TaxID=882626 RepID=UPI0027E3D502|nr:response regulator [Pseudoalteromonas xiamenensis]WMN60642.1 response regulator [Pseudoalteromonas xiamenensis]
MISKLNVLLVEDDDVSAEAVIRSLRKVDVDLCITVADNGKIALDILNNTHPTLFLEHPFLVLLDLNMPVMNGFEFLDAVRTDPKLKDIVVFILTTSDDDRDKSKAYHQNVAGYMVKSSVGPQFARLSTLLEAYKDAIDLNCR